MPGRRSRCVECGRVVWNRALPSVDGNRERTDPDPAREASRHAPGRITRLLATLDEAVDDGPPQVRHLIRALGNLSFAAMLLAPALIVVSPASGIFGLPSVAGIVIALIAVQMVAGRDHLWLPDWIMRRELNRQRVHRALALAERPVGWIERISRPRLTWLVHPPLSRGLQILCMLCGLAMPMLELLPLTSSILGLAVVLMAMAMVAEDGLLALLGIAVAVAGAVTVTVLTLGVVAVVAD
jgi:hypothetical protein